MATRSTAPELISRGATAKAARASIDKFRVRFAQTDLAGLPYLFFAGACVLLSARLFYDDLALQLFYSAARAHTRLTAVDWSAPLDDVFIHFDFARSAARGHPFEWSAGNGYSSGGTSLLYPFVLAPGFFLGFGGTRIMHFAAIVASTSLFGVLLGARRLFRNLPRWTLFVAPPALLSVGALDWSLWSGMEVAFFLAVWALAFVAWDDVTSGPPGVPKWSTPWAVFRLGVANALMVATRPEAIVLAFVFACSAAFSTRARRGTRAAFLVFASSMVLPVSVVVGQAIANRIFTGDFSAAGALVKLEMYDPRLTPREVWESWLFFVRYQIGRVTGYHVAGSLVFGSLLWVVAALSLASKSTRRYGLLLFAQAIVWVLVVALNGQVRWQNERYTMPALAFMLLAAALGVAVAASHTFEGWKNASRGRAASRLGIAAAIAVLVVHQLPRMRDQIWFFGRASRNIHDQQIAAGRKLRNDLPGVRRVLVGDAGAIPYASDLPALDIIGLGGYPGLPFARASKWGVASAIELIEHIPSRERPDILAIYPGWWGDFPLWFGHPLGGISVRGNVICGGLTKMIYAANWRSLDDGRAPSTPLADREDAVDEVDFADILSEKYHRYRIRGAPGFVAMKLLPYPNGDRGLWDGGRVLPSGASVQFSLSGLSPNVTTHLWVRTAPSRPATLRFRVGGQDTGALSLEPTNGWSETNIEVPRSRVTRRLDVEITAEKTEVILYHLWGVQRP